MSRFIIKMQESYLEYSTVVDAPVTFGMTLEQFKEYYRNEYGLSEMENLERRLERVERKGTSSLVDVSMKETVFNNHAGPNGSRLTIGELYKAYCLLEPIRGGWTVPRGVSE